MRIHSFSLYVRWLNHVSLAVKTDFDVSNVSWSAFHASSEDASKIKDVPTTTSCLLPLFQEDAATVAMVRHSMDVIKKITDHTNPGQVPVITVDQPLFTLAKNIQWKWPQKYGESRFVIMFGGLHLEMAALKSLGHLLEGSGWTPALVQAGVAKSGTADSFIKAAHVTRTRRAHQVTACALYEALSDAYTEYVDSAAEPNSEIKSKEEWCTEMEESQPSFKFWSTVLQMELTVLVFIRAIRKGDFMLYVQSLSKLVPHFFTFDQYNYARWVSVHLRDMVTLSERHPQIFAEFKSGKFTVRKTCHAFSRIATDHAHEQNNADVKDDGGAIGLTESPAALERWMVSGPEMASLINDFEKSTSTAQSSQDFRRHDQRPGVQKAFLQDVKSLKATIDELGNPFRETSRDLLVLDTRDLADQSAVETLYKLADTGTKQYHNFVQDRLVDKKKPLDLILDAIIPKSSSQVKLCLDELRSRVIRECHGQVYSTKCNKYTIRYCKVIGASKNIVLVSIVHWNPHEAASS